MKLLFQVLTCRICGLCVVIENEVCEYSCFSSLLIAGLNVSPGGMSAPQRQKFRTDDINQCLHIKSGSHGFPK